MAHYFIQMDGDLPQDVLNEARVVFREGVLIKHNHTMPTGIRSQSIAFEYGPDGSCVAVKHKMEVPTPDKETTHEQH